MEMTELRRIAVYKATKAGFEDLAEDFAQDALMKLSQGRKANLDQLLVDFLRVEYGRSSSSDKRGLHWAEKRSYIELEDDNSSEDYVSDIDFLHYIRKLEGQDRAMILLAHKWGLTLGEIGDCFGVSESRISQKLMRLHEIIGKNLKRTALNNC